MNPSEKMTSRICLRSSEFEGRSFITSVAASDISTTLTRVWLVERARSRCDACARASIAAKNVRGRWLVSPNATLLEVSRRKTTLAARRSHSAKSENPINEDPF